LETCFFPSDYPFKEPQLTIFTPNGVIEVLEEMTLASLGGPFQMWSPQFTIPGVVFNIARVLQDAVTIENKKSLEAYAIQSLEYNLSDPNFVHLFSTYFKLLKIKEISISNNIMEREKESTKSSYFSVENEKEEHEKLVKTNCSDQKSSEINYSGKITFAESLEDSFEKTGKSSSVFEELKAEKPEPNLADTKEEFELIEKVNNCKIVDSNDEGEITIQNQKIEEKTIPSAPRGLMSTFKSYLKW